jgi:hypothetical protein
MRMRLSSRALLGCLAGLLMTASVGLFTTACFVIAQQPEPKKSSLPDGLRHVPPDALGFVHVRVGDFLKSELGSQLLKEIQQDKDAQKGMQNLEREIERLLGVHVADVNSVTLVMLSAPTNAQIQASQMRMFNVPHNHMQDRRFMDKMPAKDFPFKDAVPKDFEKKDAFRFEKIEGRIPEFEPWAVQEQMVSYQPFGVQTPLEYLAMSGPLVIVSSTKALDRKKILASTLTPQNSRGGMFPGGSFLFLSDRTVMLGNAWEIERYSEQMARNPGPKATPMQSALALGAKPHMVVAGGHVPAQVRQAFTMGHGFVLGELVRALAPVSPLMQAESGLTLDLGKQLDVAMQFKASTDASAEQALQAVKNLRVLAELAIDKSNEAGEPGGWKLTLQTQIRKALADAVIEQEGTTVRARLKMEFDPALVKRFTKEYVATVRVKVDRTESMNNLKIIGLAMHNFHDANKRMPPAGISSINDPTGKPLLSWRVAILPYIEEGQLYQQFDLTQPWDHPTNKKLIPRMPQVYVVPGTENKNGMTHYRVLVGPQTMFESGQRISLSSITDGTSNTIMTVEAKDPTTWTRPDDLPFDPKGALPKLGISPDGFLAGFGDGTVRFIRSNIAPDHLRALITRNGGEPVSVPE